MVILLFGVTNVGKTVTGERLAEKLGYSFEDLDEEIISYMRSVPLKILRTNISLTTSR